MVILHLTPELPYAPGGTGGATRQYHLLRRLRERGHEVAVVAPATAEEEGRADDLRALGVRVEAVRRPRSRVVEASRALVRRPRLLPEMAARPVLAWQVGVFWAHLGAIARRLIEERRPDVVVVEHDYSAAWARDLPAGLPLVLTFHNVSWAYYARRAEAADGVAARALALEARRFRAYDRRHVPPYRLLVAVSDPDRDELEREGFGPVEVVPNGVATGEIGPFPDPDGPPTLLFTGTMNYAPNVEGVRWFVERVWPAVVSRLPDARLVVAGRDPPEGIRRLGDDPQIEVTGSVPAFGPYFERATAVIVPLRSGGGTRLKVLEALAAGRPIVSTTVGAEGLDLRPGEELLLADTPGHFADATCRLLGDPGLRRRLGSAGRAAAETQYDWTSLGDRFEAVLLSAL